MTQFVFLFGFFFWGCVLPHVPFDRVEYCRRFPEAGLCACVRAPDSEVCLQQDASDAPSEVIVAADAADVMGTDTVDASSDRVLPPDVEVSDAVDAMPDLVVLPDVVTVDVLPDMPPPPDVVVMDTGRPDIVDVTMADMVDVVETGADAASEADVVTYPPAILFRQDTEPMVTDYYVRWTLPGGAMTTWANGHCMGAVSSETRSGMTYSRCNLDIAFPAATQFEFYPVRAGGARSCDPPSSCGAYPDRFILEFGTRTYQNVPGTTSILLFNEVIDSGVVGSFLHLTL
jgi:hypothetical protein